MRSSSSSGARQLRYVPCLLLGALAWYAMTYTGPAFHGEVFESAINWPGFTATGVLLHCVCIAASDLLWQISKGFEAAAGGTPTGHKGTAAFLHDPEDLASELAPRDESGMRRGSYFGAMQGEPITTRFASNALVIGTSGSGKTVGVVQPTILTDPNSKLITDLKSENTAVLLRALEENGEEVRVLNIGDVNAGIIGPSDHYNPLNLLADNYWREGGLRDVSDDVFEMAMQLYPEPAQGGGNDNKYFRDGSRDLISFAIQVSILIDGYQATLGDVGGLLNDREALRNHALWICGKLQLENPEPEAA